MLLTLTKSIHFYAAALTLSLTFCPKTQVTWSRWSQIFIFQWDNLHHEHLQKPRLACIGASMKLEGKSQHAFYAAEFLLVQAGVCVSGNTSRSIGELFLEPPGIRTTPERLASHSSSSRGESRTGGRGKRAENRMRVKDNRRRPASIQKKSSQHHVARGRGGWQLHRFEGEIG